MGMFFINSAAEARGMAPPVRPFEDGVTNIREAAHPLPVISQIPAGGYDPFPAPAYARRAVMPQNFTLRPFDVWSARDLTGTHGMVQRVPGSPVGQLQPGPVPVRAVFRPLPQAWDAGFQAPGDFGQ